MSGTKYRTSVAGQQFVQFVFGHATHLGPVRNLIAKLIEVIHSLSPPQAVLPRRDNEGHFFLGAFDHDWPLLCGVEDVVEFRVTDKLGGTSHGDDLLRHSTGFVQCYLRLRSRLAASTIVGKQTQIPRGNGN